MSVHKSSTSVALLIVVSSVLAACAPLPRVTPPPQTEVQDATVVQTATPAGQHVAILVMDDFAPDLLCNPIEGKVCPFVQKLKAQRSSGFIDGCAVMDKTGEGGSLDYSTGAKPHGELITRELESLITALPATPLDATAMYSRVAQAGPLVSGGEVTTTILMTEAIPQIQSWQYQNNTLTVVAVDMDLFTSGMISDTLDYVITALHEREKVTRFVINMSFVFIVCDENGQPENVLGLVGDPAALATLNEAIASAINLSGMSPAQADEFKNDIYTLRSDPLLLRKISIPPILGLEIKLDDQRTLQTDGSIVYAGAYTQKLDGTIELAPGAERLPDGRIRMANQDVVLPEVFTQKPDGQVLPIGSTSVIDQVKFQSLKQQIVAVPQQYVAQKTPAGEVQYTALGDSVRQANGTLKLVSGHVLQKDLSVLRPDASNVRFDKTARKFVVHSSIDPSGVPDVLDELPRVVAQVAFSSAALPTVPLTQVIKEGVFVPRELDMEPEQLTRLSKAYFTLRKAVLYNNISASYGLNTAPGAQSAAPIVPLASGRLVSRTLSATASVTETILTEVLPLYENFQAQDKNPDLRVIRIAAAGNGPSLSVAVPVTFPLAPAMWNNVLSVSAIVPSKPVTSEKQIWSYPGEVALLGDHPSPEASGLISDTDKLGTSFAAPRMSLMAALYLLKSDQLACQGPEGLTQPPLKYANVHQSPKWENLPLEMAADRYCTAFKVVLK